jgi:hypothetical protein
MIVVGHQAAVARIIAKTDKRRFEPDKTGSGLGTLLHG